MAVGAYASYKFMTAFPDLNIFFVIILSGFVTAFVGTLFGLPSLRIKGFFLFTFDLIQKQKGIKNFFNILSLFLNLFSFVSCEKINLKQLDFTFL